MSHRYCDTIRIQEVDFQCIEQLGLYMVPKVDVDDNAIQDRMKAVLNSERVGFRLIAPVSLRMGVRTCDPRSDTNFRLVVTHYRFNASRALTTWRTSVEMSLDDLLSLVFIDSPKIWVMCCLDFPLNSGIEFSDAHRRRLSYLAEVCICCDSSSLLWCCKHVWFGSRLSHVPSHECALYGRVYHDHTKWRLPHLFSIALGCLFWRKPPWWLSINI